MATQQHIKESIREVQVVVSTLHVSCNKAGEDIGAPALSKNSTIVEFQTKELSLVWGLGRV